jgi:hypothetical protein
MLMGIVNPFHTVPKDSDECNASFPSSSSPEILDYENMFFRIFFALAESSNCSTG